jgi:hypothetical protein
MDWQRTTDGLQWTIKSSLRELVTFNEDAACYPKYVEYANACCLASFQGDIDG